MHSFSSLYNEHTVISREYTGPLDCDITGIDCICKKNERRIVTSKMCLQVRMSYVDFCIFFVFLITLFTFTFTYNQICFKVQISICFWLKCF